MHSQDYKWGAFNGIGGSYIMARGDRLLKVMKKASQNANPDTKYTDLMYGVVQNINPLTVLIDNRLELTEDFLILSPFCYKTKFSVSFDAHRHDVTVDTISQEDHVHGATDIAVKGHKHKVDDKDTTEAGEQSIAGAESKKAGGFSITPQANCGDAGAHRFTVTLWDDLQIGDKLAMLRVAQGQAYLVLYRDKLEVRVS